MGWKVHHSNSRSSSFMIFTECNLSGAYIIQPNLINDERGFFTRSFCQKEFLAKGLKSNIKQCNVSFNIKKGTIRGMHYQTTPYQEAKLIRCTKGKVYDVIIDLRPHSSTYKQSITVELSETNRKMLYVPENFAHGFQTLEDNTELFYHMFETFNPSFSAGLRWNDPSFSIDWPLSISHISEKDISYKDYSL